MRKNAAFRDSKMIIIDEFFKKLTNINRLNAPMRSKCLEKSGTISANELVVYLHRNATEADRVKSNLGNETREESLKRAVGEYEDGGHGRLQP